MRQSGRPARHTAAPVNHGKPSYARADRGIAPPSVLFQPEGRSAVSPGKRQTDNRRVQNPRPRIRRDQRRDRPDAGDIKTPPAGNLPEGMGRSGSLMASTSRSYQSLTAWLVAQIRGPARAIPATTTVQCAGAKSPLETTPQPNAHMGANHVIGLSSSRTAAG